MDQTNHVINHTTAVVEDVSERRTELMAEAGMNADQSAILFREPMAESWRFFRVVQIRQVFKQVHRGKHAISPELFAELVCRQATRKYIDISKFSRAIDNTQADSKNNGVPERQLLHPPVTTVLAMTAR